MLRALLPVIFFGIWRGSNAQNISTADYPFETHHVTTSGGYILGLHRIPYGRNLVPGPRKCVLIMHGMFGGSNSFTYLGPEYAIAYNLADAGYDVWMGNVRGNRYSRNHVSLDPDKDKRKFFDYNLNDIAMSDLPATIDFVLKTTGQDKLHYVGQNQGGTLFFMLNSRTTRYHSKIASAHLLGAIGYEKNFPSKKIKILTTGIDAFYATGLLAGDVELYPTGPGSSGTNMATTIIDKNLEFNAPREILAGGSLKQFVHLGQNIRDACFCDWNYGLVKNSFIYGTALPPAYDMSKIKNKNITLFCSSNDILQNVADTMAMADAIPNARVHKIADDSFPHLGYILNKEVKELVTDHIIESLKKL